MLIGEAKRVIGDAVSRLQDTHGHYEYLEVPRYQYFGCTYELLLNFEGRSGGLSEIVLTHHAEARAAEAERACRDGLERLRGQIGRPISASGGVQMWRVNNTTVTVMEGRRGVLQIRYTATKPITN